MVFPIGNTKYTICTLLLGIFALFAFARNGRAFFTYKFNDNPSAGVVCYMWAHSGVIPFLSPMTRSLLDITP